jgi:hypothetical protein
MFRKGIAKLFGKNHRNVRRRGVSYRFVRAEVLEERVLLAGDVQWTDGAGDHDFKTAGNWFPAAVPGPANPLPGVPDKGIFLGLGFVDVTDVREVAALDVISSADTELTFADGSQLRVAVLLVGKQFVAGDLARFTINGSFADNEISFIADQIMVGTQGDGWLVINGAAQTGGFFVGGNRGVAPYNATLDIESGATLLLDPLFESFVGGENSFGSLNVRGTIEGSDANIVVGANDGGVFATGTIDVDGGSMDVDGLYIGGSESVTVGAASWGTLIIRNSSWVNAQTLVVAAGKTATTTGDVTILASTLLTVAGVVDVGHGGNGNFTLYEGAQATIGGAFLVGSNKGMDRGVGTASVQGNLTAAEIGVGTNTATGTLNIAEGKGTQLFFGAEGRGGRVCGFLPNVAELVSFCGGEFTLTLWGDCGGRHRCGDPLNVRSLEGSRRDAGGRGRGTGLAGFVSFRRILRDRY